MRINQQKQKLIKKEEDAKLRRCFACALLMAIRTGRTTSLHGRVFMNAPQSRIESEAKRWSFWRVICILKWKVYCTCPSNFVREISLAHRPYGNEVLHNPRRLQFRIFHLTELSKEQHAGETTFMMKSIQDYKLSK